MSYYVYVFIEKNLLNVKKVIFIVYYYCTMLHILAQIIQRWFADMHKPPFCKYWKIKKTWKIRGKKTRIWDF